MLKGHNAVTPVRLEPAASRSRVKHSTTEPLRSPYFLIYYFATFSADYHSTRGPIAVSGIPPELSNMHELFLSAGEEMQYKPVDCTGKDNIGKRDHVGHLTRI